MAAFRSLLHDEVAKGRDAETFRRDLDLSGAAALLLSLVKGSRSAGGNDTSANFCAWSAASISLFVWMYEQ